MNVVEIGDGAAGGFAGMLLAATGARVTRVVAPGAADRDAGATSGERYLRAYLDRDKERMELDLATEAGRAALLTLLDGTDALVETLGPGGLDRVAGGFEALHAARPGLVVTSITPFGLEGPRAGWKATDLLVQAAGGLLASSGHSEGPPTRLAGEQAAHVTGVLAALQTAAAVHGVRNGATPGVHLDVSMQEVMSSHWVREIGRYVYTGEGLARPDPRLGLQGFPHTARAADGYVFLLALGATWEDFGTFLGLEEFTTSEWSDAETRAARWSEIEPHFERSLASRGRYEWFAAGAEHGYTLAPVDDALSILESPQLAARAYFERREVDGREVPVPAIPFTFAGREHPRATGSSEADRPPTG